MTAEESQKPESDIKKKMKTQEGIPSETLENQPNEESEIKTTDKNETKPEEQPKEEMVEIPKKRLEELEVVEGKALEELKLARADAINYRKRLEKQRDEFAEYASSRVLTKLLDVHDDVLRIIENGKDAIPEEHFGGIQLLQQRMQGIFDSENVKLLTVQEGKTKFDPVKHEAILAQPSEDVAPNTVITHVASGFVKGERVLRAAKVIISQALPKPTEPEKQQEATETAPKENASNSEDSEKK